MKKTDYFKIRVTPEQSEAVQIALFKSGVMWAGNTSTIKNTTNPFLFNTKRGITFALCGSDTDFNLNILPELTFEEFKTRYNVR